MNFCLWKSMVSGFRINVPGIFSFAVTVPEWTLTKIEKFYIFTTWLISQSAK